jgi:predicted small metal-binding protein
MASPETKHDAFVVRCDCGFEARGNADEVVDAMQDHARNVHNMNATREQVLARAEAV